MANPSKRYPHVVELWFPAIAKWIAIGAYRTPREADQAFRNAVENQPGETFRKTEVEA